MPLIVSPCMTMCSLLKSAVWRLTSFDSRSGSINSLKVTLSLARTGDPSSANIVNFWLTRASTQSNCSDAHDTCNTGGGSVQDGDAADVAACATVIEKTVDRVCQFVIRVGRRLEVAKLVLELLPVYYELRFASRGNTEENWDRIPFVIHLQNRVAVSVLLYAAVFHHYLKLS
jgi:hypothetical protein